MRSSPLSCNVCKFTQLLCGLLAHLACADGRAVDDRVRQEASELQLLENMQRMLWLLALLACADGRAVGDHGVQEASDLELLEPALMAASYDHGAQEASDLELLEPALMAAL